VERLPSKTVLAFVGTAFLYVLLFIFVDRPVDLWVHARFAGSRVHTLGSAVSGLASSPLVETGLSLGLLTAVIGVVSNGGKERPWTMPLFYVCLSCAAAIVIGEGLKIILARYRPVMLFEQNLYGFHFFSTEWALNSTPSGHTLRAFSVMTALSVLFRHRWIPLIGAAALVGLGRIAVTAHYPGDVLFGAFIGVFTALWVYRYLAPSLARSRNINNPGRPDLN